MAIKIKKIEVIKNMVKITTNNKDRPIFKYPVDKFSNYTSLKNEIDKSIKIEKVKKDKKNFKVKKIQEDFLFELELDGVI